MSLVLYSSSLLQSSVCHWPIANIESTDNIDYDDIKYLIKERTTPGKGKTVDVPGRGDERLVEFEIALFHILEDQHQRIDLFVRSKTGEIQRRLGKWTVHVPPVVHAIAVALRIADRVQTTPRSS